MLDDIKPGDGDGAGSGNDDGGVEGKPTGEGAGGKATDAGAPEIDYSKISEHSKTAFKEALKEVSEEFQSQSRPASTGGGQREVADPFGELVAPHVAKVAGPALAAAYQAADAATFYAEASDSERALKIKYKDKIEGLIASEARQGRYQARDAVWKYLKGGELHDEIVEAKIAARDRKLREAELEKEAGAGSARSYKTPKKPLDAMNEAEITEYLGDSPF